MNSKHRVNRFNYIVAIITALLFGFFGLYNLLRLETVGLIVFTALSLLFAYIATEEGAIVQITSSSVKLSKRGKTVAVYSWDDMNEIGVVGLKLFGSTLDNMTEMFQTSLFDKVNNAKKRKRVKHGTKYIYFSKTKMTGEEVFDMCLRWPPKDKIVVVYNYKLLCDIQSIWSSKIRLYNADDVEMP